MAHPSSPPEVAILLGDQEYARARQRQVPASHVSRSYSEPLAAVAWHDGPVGVDIERIAELDEDFCMSICTPEERPLLRGAGEAALTAAWSSKEALAKALGDAVDYDPRRLGAPMFWPGGTAGRWRTRALELPDGYVGWLCWTD